MSTTVLKINPQEFREPDHVFENIRLRRLLCDRNYWRFVGAFAQFGSVLDRGLGKSRAGHRIPRISEIRCTSLDFRERHTSRFPVNAVRAALEYAGLKLAGIDRVAYSWRVTPSKCLNMCLYVCGIVHLQEIHFPWRPALTDPGDEFVLELAVAAGCKAIVTHPRHPKCGPTHWGVLDTSAQPFELSEMSCFGAC